MLTRSAYEQFIYSLPVRYPSIQLSTLVIVPPNSTHPHHKHIRPDIKHNRIPASGLQFDAPNLPFLIEEIEQSLMA